MRVSIAETTTSILHVETRKRQNNGKVDEEGEETGGKRGRKGKMVVQIGGEETFNGSRMTDAVTQHR